MGSPFKEAAQEYFDKGWLPVPLPYKKKANPPVGYTGRSVTKEIDQATIDKWLVIKKPQNIAIKFTDDLIGIDVDNYGDHGGAETLKELEAKHGRLPDTCSVTSRTDGISGIRLYKVPPGLSWAGKYGPGIDVIQAGHRYAVVWPSIHPEDRQYAWRDNAIPLYSDVPALPESLVSDLSQGPVGEVLAASDITTKEANEWLQALPGGKICWTVHNALENTREAIVSNRHDTMKGAQWQLMRLGMEGHRGVRRALAELRDMFYEEVSGDPEREKAAAHEYYSALNSGAKKNYEVTREGVCDCGEVPDLEATTSEPVRERKTKGLVITPAEDFEAKATIWLWGPSKHKRDQDGFVPLGELVLLAGAENLGKSTLAADMAANLSRGTMRGKFLGVPKSVFIGTTEDDWGRTIRPRLEAANANLKKVFRIESHDTGVLSLPKDIENLEREIKNYDVAMLILDPLNSTLDARLDTHKDAEVRRALEPLVKIAHETECTILGLIHRNKRETSDPTKSIMASGAYVAVARTVMYVVKHPEEPDIRVLGIPKNNLAKTDPDSLTFTIVEKHVGWDHEADEPITASKLEWTGTIDLNIKDVLEQAKGSKGHGHPAQDWLQKYLQEQARCVPSREVNEAAKEAGISESQLQRARKALNVEVVRTKTVPSTTCWQDTAQGLLDTMMTKEKE